MKSLRKSTVVAVILTNGLIGCGQGHKKTSTDAPHDTVGTEPQTSASTAPKEAGKGVSPSPSSSPTPAVDTPSNKPYFNFDSLQGKYFKTPCLVYKSTDTLDNSVAVIYELRFSESLDSTQTATTYTDAACAAPQLRYRSRVSMNQMSSEGTIDSTLEEASITPLNDLVDKLWSEKQRGGYQNWKNGAALPVFSRFYDRTELTLVFGRKTAKTYQRYAMEASSFYWGQLDEAHDGSSAEMRPLTIDKSVMFVLQP